MKREMNDRFVLMRLKLPILLVEPPSDGAFRLPPLPFPRARNAAVYKGAAKPLTRPRRNCPEIHGASGLDGPDIPTAPRGASEEKAVNAIARAATAVAASGEIMTLVATGALTNVALYASMYPELLRHTDVVIMGGAMGQGNTNPVAEFNIQCDPEAAHIVFECEARRLVVVPLEVTHTALVTPEVRSALLRGGGDASGSGRGDERSGSRFRVLVDELLQFFAQTYKDVFAFDHPPLHDPCAVAYVLRPDMFTVRRLRVDVETKSELSAGQTVCDVWKQSGKKPNAEVCVEMKVDQFWKMMCDAVDKADAACPLS